MKILLHSSKTMRAGTEKSQDTTVPEFLRDATQINKFLKGLSPNQIAKIMKISLKLADSVSSNISTWGSNGKTTAYSCFRGDIYSGLQSASWNKSDLEYAQTSIRILSGLYGVLRPKDAIEPYRLEMGYKFSVLGHKDLYDFWSTKLQKYFAKEDILINLSAEEYIKTIGTKELRNKMISPKFMTISPKTGEPVFVVVHAKIARGAFANWMVKNKIQNLSDIIKFNDLGYKYVANLSTKNQPVFVCESFKGLGLSVRLK